MTAIRPIDRLDTHEVFNQPPLTVAAYPVTGPADIFRDGIGGALSDNLREACLAALELDRSAARAKALTYSWDNCATMLMDRFNEI